MSSVTILFGLASRSLFESISESKFGRLGLLGPGFRMEIIAKTIFSQKTFLWISEVFLSFFGGPGTICVVFAALEKGLRIDGILVVQRIQSRAVARGE